MVCDQLKREPGYYVLISKDEAPTIAIFENFDSKIGPGFFLFPSKYGVDECIFIPETGLNDSTVLFGPIDLTEYVRNHPDQSSEKTNRILTGKELLVAAQNGLPVWYKETCPDPTGVEFSQKVQIKSWNEEEWVIGPGCIDAEYLEALIKKNAVVRYDLLDGGFVAIYAVAGVEYA